MFDIRVPFIVVTLNGACASHIDGSGETRCLENTIAVYSAINITIFGLDPILDSLTSFEKLNVNELKKKLVHAKLYVQYFRLIKTSLIIPIRRERLKFCVAAAFYLTD